MGYEQREDFGDSSFDGAVQARGVSEQEVLSDREELVCNMAQMHIAEAEFQSLEPGHTLTDNDLTRWIETDSATFRSWCNGEGRELIQECAHQMDSAGSDEAIGTVVSAYRSYRREQAH